MVTQPSRGELLAKINRRKRGIRTQLLNAHKALRNTAEEFGDTPELRAERAELVALIDILDNGVPDDPDNTHTEESPA